MIALKANIDLEMPGPKPRRGQAVIDAVREGWLDSASSIFRRLYCPTPL